MSVPAFEKLSAFYLGKEYDFDKGAVTDDLVVYDAKDLTTHAVCVGMTGSGKTGLCVSLLEEAALDGVPAIAIDPKGDLGNLMLTFPDLQAGDFEPWIDEGAATRKGLSVPEFANKTASLWRNGLASWGQDGDRIRRLKEAADFSIYTPGSNAGLPITVLRSFKAPPAALLDDGDAMRERVMSAVSGLLALLGIDADPIRSREHILLSNIIDKAWRAGRDLDIGALIQEITNPPFERIGVMDIEAFFPAKDRFELAMTLNNLLASPGFAAWMQGEALDVQRLMWTPEGKPRISIISIAHLSDHERMFFVTLLLNEVVAWMRTQPGTTSLRALLYMDEVFGFFPPTANPPSKTPLLTLMKQARAFGLGVMLATQNPVDLDYKGLSNAGTWFLGRLQTERDKARVLDGLEGASASAGQAFNRAKVEQILSGVRSRVFLMNNVHEDAPVVFHTRWAMSYLRGPLTRGQITTLMKPRKDGGPVSRPTPLGGSAAAPPQAEPQKGRVKAARPAMPPDVPEAFVMRAVGGHTSGRLVYRPALFARARLHFANATRGIDDWRDVALLCPLSGGKAPADPWGKSAVYGDDAPSLDTEPEDAAEYAALPGGAADVKRLKSWGTKLKSWLYRDQSLALWHCPSLKMWSEGGEAEGDFMARARQALREKRELAVEKLRKRYQGKFERLRNRIRKADEKIAKEQRDVSSQKRSTVISVGQTILGAIFGRKVGVGTAGRAGTTMRRADRVAKEKEDVARAEADAKARREELQTLETEFQRDSDALDEKYNSETLEILAKPLAPRKSDIAIEGLSIAWTPWVVDESGIATPVFPTRQA